MRLNDIFDSFDPKPLAAASIAQVHVATLKNGPEVVVKILRPGMRESIDLDLEVLDYLADLPTGIGRRRAVFVPSSWCANTARPFSMSWICCAKQAMRRS